MNINWYPGHMKKTKKAIKRDLTLVDIVFELRDARVPYSSKNPIIDSILQDKDRIIILNKSDLANENGNKKWQDYFKQNNIESVLIDSVTGKGLNKLISTANKLTKNKIKAYERKGIINRPTRAMIIGIPNVGKSTLINSLSGRRGASVGDKPGITKANQWIKIKGNLEMLDTPGMLWPKFEDEKIGLYLALTGAIKDEILDVGTLALNFIEIMIKDYPELLEKRYNFEINDKSPLEVMEKIGFKRGCIIRGGEIDYTKVSNLILDEFRKGIIGNITLELP
ncbi:MAG TPA: ribosome biogenesis GTPase YlqF [Tissierellaceae bacterium]|nr:ribosome biogenesis GTPase YlqF [Tissierellaceae bacterium]